MLFKGRERLMLMVQKIRSINREIQHLVDQAISSDRIHRIW